MIFCSLSEVLLRSEDAQRLPHAWFGQIAHIKGCMGDGLAETEAAVNSCKLASPKRCKNASVVAKRSRPSAPANSSKSFRSLSLTTSPRLSASKSRSISAWLIGCLKAMQASTSRLAVVI
jgi:hypothetical protein